MKKLADWARRVGISPRTAYQMWVEDRLPYPSQKISDRIILIDAPQNKTNNKKQCVTYARVSSADQKQNIPRQTQRLIEYANKNGYHVTNTYTEIDSGLNDKRKILNSILKNPEITTIIVEHKDKLTHHSFNLIQAALQAQNRQIIIIKEQETESSLADDVGSVTQQSLPVVPVSRAQALAISLEVAANERLGRETPAWQRRIASLVQLNFVRILL